MLIDKITLSSSRSSRIVPKRLGELLLEADLISVDQIKVALYDQSYNCDLRLGEILAIRNWIPQETANFFAHDWSHLIKQKSRKPIGWYLQQASLLKEGDIEKILNEQKHTGVRFGTVAVLQGFLKSTTLDFFLMYLFPKQLTTSPCKSIHFLKENRQLPSKKSTANLSEHHIKVSADDLEADAWEIKWID